jgi:hypothetical protein
MILIIPEEGGNVVVSSIKPVATPNNNTGRLGAGIFHQQHIGTRKHSLLTRQILR